MAGSSDESQNQASPASSGAKLPFLIPPRNTSPATDSDGDGSVIVTPTTSEDEDGIFYEPLQTDCFRLFKVVSSTPPTLTVELKQYSLFSSLLPGYQVLSYTQEKDEAGDEDQERDSPAPSVSRVVSCNGEHITVQHITVPRSLYRLLGKASIVGHLYWAEDICVNKDDEGERNEHVLLTPRVIHNARSVVFWLGSRTHRLLPRVLEDFASESWNDEGSLIRGQLRHEHIAIAPTHEGFTSVLGDRGWAMPRGGDASMMEILEIFRRPWFRRASMVHDILLARNAEVRCENWRMPWTTFRQVALFVASRYPGSVDPELRAVMNLDLNSRDRGFSGEFEQRYQWQMHRYKEAMASGKSRILRPSNLLAVSRPQHFGRSATDHLDLIYSVLGAAASIWLPGRCAFAPDYALSVRETYIRTARVIIQGEQNLNILAAVHRRRGWPATPDLLLPSWVPDWRSQLLCDGFSQVQGLATFDYQVTQGALGTPINAAPISELPTLMDPLKEKSRLPSRDGTDDELRVQGLRIDTVHRIIDLSDLKNLLQFDEDNDDPPPHLDWRGIIAVLRNIIKRIQSELRKDDTTNNSANDAGADAEATTPTVTDRSAEEDLFSVIFTALTAGRFRTVQGSGSSVKYSFLVYLEQAHWMTPLTGAMHIRPPPPPGLVQPRPQRLQTHAETPAPRLARTAEPYRIVAQRRKQDKQQQAMPRLTLDTTAGGMARLPIPPNPMAPASPSASSPPTASSARDARDALLQRMARALLVDQPAASDAFFAPWNAYAAAYGALGPVGGRSSEPHPLTPAPSPTPSCASSTDSWSEPPPTPATSDEDEKCVEKEEDDDEESTAAPDPEPVQARLARELIRLLARVLRGRSLAILAPAQLTSRPSSSQPPSAAEAHRHLRRRRVALVPSSAAPDDEVFILQGGDVPFLFRRRRDSASEKNLPRPAVPVARYLVLGDAFVPGIMDGEAVEVVPAARRPPGGGSPMGSAAAKVVVRGVDGREFEDLDLV